MTPRKHKQHKEKNKDLAAKIKKIVWVNNSEEDYSTEFKNKINRNEFPSIAAAYKDAQIIYSEHCPDYKSNKAVIKIVNGKKTVKKKEEIAAIVEPIDPLVTSTPKDPEPTIRRDQLLEQLKQMLDSLREIPTLKNEQLRHRLSQNSDANNFLNSIEGYTAPSTYQKRIGDYI